MTSSIRFLDNLTLDKFRLDSENRTGFIVNHGLDAITLDSFTLDARRQLTAESEVIIKYNQASMVYPECQIRYIQAGQVFSDSKIKYDQHSYIINNCKIKYRQVHYVNNLTKIKYDQHNFVYPEIRLKYNQASMVYPESKIKYDQHSYIINDCKIKYRQLHSINNLTKIKYDQHNFINSEIRLKYNQLSMVYPEIKIKYDQHSYISKLLKILYVQGPPLSTTLINYLEVTTLQGSKMYPIIEDASIEKGVDIDTAKITIFENIPPYSLCRLYVNYNIVLFEGISTSCPKKGNVYELEVVDYLEHLQPNSPKPGLYLRKYEWTNVQLQYFLSSNKPTLNNNTLGLLYMANSVVPHVLFEVHDVNNHIYVWTITGSAQTITEVFEDITLLTARSSLTQLLTLSGWYYDSATNKFYVRHTDNVSPYDHVLTIPNIWDGPMPIRLGVLSTTKGTTVIAYAQTADFDIPLETINTYLYSLELEYESSIRNGITYIDVSETRGAGSSANPANTYVTSLNILKINEIDLNNAKYSTNGVFMQGYGSGAGSITAGIYRNMGIGGRFIFLEDASIHGEAQATDYVENYLEEMYLPSQSITFEAPLDIMGIYDNRSIGDYVKVIIPVEDFVEDLRIQKLQIFLKDSVIKITAGDRLFSLEQKLKAIKSANEKYRKHLEDTVEEISLNWDSNIDSGLGADFDFEIKDNTLSIQKLEISYDISKMVVDSTGNSPTNSPAGGGGEGGGVAGEAQGTGHTHKIKAGEKADASTMTVEVALKTHLHPLSLTNMGAPTSIAYIPTVNHTHPSGTLKNNTPDNAAPVINTLLYGNCTAPNCVRIFACGSTTTSVSASNHLHPIYGSTGVPSDTSGEVAGPGHRHTGNTDNNTSGVFVSNKDHDHNIGGKEVSQQATEQKITMPESNTWTPPGEFQNENGDWLDCETRAEVPAGNEEMSILNPDMYLSLSIVSGSTVTPIAGSPFIVSTEDVSKNSGGPILIDSIVNTDGKYKIRASVSNKSEPGSACRCKLAVRLNGRIFVDSIYSG